MPLVLNAAEITAALEVGGSDLKFLFEKNEVDNELQFMFFHSKITSIARFTGFVKDAVDLRKLVMNSELMVTHC